MDDESNIGMEVTAALAKAEPTEQQKNELAEKLRQERAKTIAELKEKKDIVGPFCATLGEPASDEDVLAGVKHGEAIVLTSPVQAENSRGKLLDGFVFLTTASGWQVACCDQDTGRYAENVLGRISTGEVIASQAGDSVYDQLGYLERPNDPVGRGGLLRELNFGGRRAAYNGNTSQTDIVPATKAQVMEALEKSLAQATLKTREEIAKIRQEAEMHSLTAQTVDAVSQKELQR